MTEETGAAAPADVLQPQGVTESEPAKPEQSVQQDAAPDAENQPQGDSQEQSDDKPRKPSRNERMRRRMQAMATELDGLRAQLDVANRKPAEDAPKEADYNGDYFAYQSAKIAYDTKQAVRAEMDADRSRSVQERQQQIQREIVEEFEERADEFRSRIQDFDDVIGRFVAQGGKFTPALAEEIQASEIGPQLAYQIVQDPQAVARLNSMSPREVAREIGRLEAKASLPQPRKQTAAPAPMTQPKGGAAPPRSITELTKGEDASDAIAFWRQEKKRA